MAEGQERVKEKAREDEVTVYDLEKKRDNEGLDSQQQLRQRKVVVVANPYNGESLVDDRLLEGLGR